MCIRDSSQFGQGVCVVADTVAVTAGPLDSPQTEGRAMEREGHLSWLVGPGWKVLRVLLPTRVKLVPPAADGWVDEGDTPPAPPPRECQL